ncbi:TPA: hypothetical protein HA251_03240 [Candidatus Woesearchaeota archaeon]|nr:hypothetical protein [Candidatus Woesearchaeota archaeon]
MKHPLSTTALLIFLFVCAQLVGVALLSLNIGDITTDQDGVRSVKHDTTVVGDRPETSGGGSLLYIVIGVAVGTALMLVIIKFKLIRFWKAWFLFAVWLSTSIALDVIIPGTIALIVCFIVAVWKVYYPNAIVHNMTEIFMYAGIAILIAPLFTLWWAIALLAIISVYDMIAVWQSKHMVVMAEAQRENKLFAGLYIPRRDTTPRPTKTPTLTDATRTDTHKPQHAAPTTRMVKTTDAAGKRVTKHIVMDEPPAPPSTTRTGKDDAAGGTKSGAILGGGDIAFPLIFSGVVMDWTITQGTSQMLALYQTLAVTIGATAALTLLFVFAKKDRYYPAMPFLSAGCLFGFAIVWLLQLR